MNKKLAGKVQAIQRQGASGTGKSTDSEGGKDEQAFALPAVPAIVLKIAEFFGIAVMAA